MANPVLSEKIFKQNVLTSESEVMTVKGTVTKTFMLTLMVIAGAAYTWKMAYEAINPASVQPWMIGGAIGGLILALIISFKPTTAPFLAPIYSVAEGLFLGGISAIFNQAFAKTAPGIVMNAVVLTLLTTLVMLFVYRTNIIKVNEKFTRIMVIAIGAIGLFYLVSIILNLFGIPLTMLHNSSPLSIGISVVIVGVAAFSLLMDFDFIEKASAAGAPKYMEWYGAFGLMVTLIWLYLEILKLLAKVAGSRN
jgi:uncharacterized YccA/Bax inhibitor family protein